MAKSLPKVTDSKYSPKNKKSYKLTSWNIASINNNPFEYWISSNDDEYDTLMKSVEAFILNPGKKDILVSDIFTHKMFFDLKIKLAENSFSDLDKISDLWNDDLCSRKIIAEFLRDKKIGKKRLCSWPERLTSRVKIRTQDDYKEEYRYRPTIINAYNKPLESISSWWDLWLKFMFEEEFHMIGASQGKTAKICDLFSPIKRSKYPDITAEEEKISRPLQSLYLAIFDAIMVHILNEVARSSWFKVKKSLLSHLILKKEKRVQEIVEDCYSDSDVVFLQEASLSFFSTLDQSRLSQDFLIPKPQLIDSKRNQNSLVLLKKSRFKSEDIKEITHDLLGYESLKHKLSSGDLCAFLVSDYNNTNYLVASYHGDTHGLLTVPVLKAFCSFLQQHKNIVFLFGLDANAHRVSKGDRLLFSDLLQFLDKNGLCSSWEGNREGKQCTTYNARTFLQTQFNKAVSKADIKSKGDINPKDFIIFEARKAKLVETKVDNTGDDLFEEDKILPSVGFPSDHAIISSQIFLC